MHRRTIKDAIFIYRIYLENQNRLRIFIAVVIRHNFSHVSLFNFVCHLRIISRSSMPVVLEIIRICWCFLWYLTQQVHAPPCSALFKAALWSRGVSLIGTFCTPPAHSPLTLWLRKLWFLITSFLHLSVNFCNAFFI